MEAARTVLVEGIQEEKGRSETGKVRHMEKASWWPVIPITQNPQQLKVSKKPVTSQKGKKSKGTVEAIGLRQKKRRVQKSEDDTTRVKQFI